jgi:hypothetical protein
VLEGHEPREADLDRGHRRLSYATPTGRLARSDESHGGI